MENKNLKFSKEELSIIEAAIKEYKAHIYYEMPALIVHCDNILAKLEEEHDGIKIDKSSKRK